MSNPMKFAAECVETKRAIERALLSTSVEELRRGLRMASQMSSARLRIINEKMAEIEQLRADRDYQADLATRWKAQFDSAAAAASEYSEFWEKHGGDFDQFDNYIPYSQMDGDLRAAKARIAELELKLAGDFR